MFTKTSTGCILLSLFMGTGQVLGRERWLERDDKPVILHPRRFGQEQPAVLQKLRDACPGPVCGTLAGQAVTPLLAAQPECSQQDMADAIIDASRQFDAATQANMVAIAVEYRQAEKNTPPDFNTSPPTLRNSVFCQKPPKNEELNGLIQAQDPANDPDVFFDPALGESVKKGEQPNTLPFNGTVPNNNDGGNGPTSSSGSAPTQVTTVKGTAIFKKAKASDPADACVTAITVTVSATNPAAVSATNAVTVTVGRPSKTAIPSPGAPLPSGVDFGRCTPPEIEFGTGFDSRRETSFRPVDRVSYPHNSAQNVDIITEFVCDSLTNSCNANQVAKDLCASAQKAVSSAQAGTGAQADIFNAVFGVRTRFADIASVDNQGNIVPGTGAGGNNDTSPTTGLDDSTPSATPPAATSAQLTDFGSCSTPEIEFAAGFDGRSETSFRPADPKSFNRDSARNIGVITRFICDELTNSCGANQEAKDTCARAAEAAEAAPAGSGAQADAFNAVFGIRSNFVDVQRSDSRGGLNGNAGGEETPQTSSSSTAPTTRPTPSNTAISPISFSNVGANLQSFTSALGGITAPAVRDIGNGRFIVDGNSEFNKVENALARSCDIQNNDCADAANASRNQDGFTVQACNQQLAQCKAAAGV